MHRERIHSLRKFLREQNLDCVLISSPSNVFYFSGFQGLSPAEREAFVFITLSNAFIITSPLYQHDIKSDTLTVQVVSAENGFIKIIDSIVNAESLKALGFEDINLTVSEFTKLSKIKIKTSPVSLAQQRTQKTQEEVRFIEKACKIGDLIFEKILTSIKPGMTEIEISSRMEILMKEKGVNPSFPTIVAFGENAAIPHHAPGKTVLKNNQFVLLDFGVKFENYCSDMTRTVFVGNPSGKEKALYETVRLSQQAALEKIKNLHKQKKEINASIIDRIARDYITNFAHEDFPHSLGHGIGIDVHESPSLSPFSKDTLREGMVFSIEPGIYVPGEVGIRIEDLFAIEKNSIIKLTHSPVDLIVL